MLKSHNLKRVSADTHKWNPHHAALRVCYCSSTFLGCSKCLWGRSVACCRQIDDVNPSISFSIALSTNPSFGDIYAAWGQCCNVSSHQGANIFVLSAEPAPTKALGGGPCPKWAITRTCWSALQLHDLSHDLVHVRTLVHEWHDAAGLSNGFTYPGRAIAIYFHRFDDTTPNKKYAHILLPDDWIIKILSYNCTQWTWRSFPRFGLASRQKLQQWSVVTIIQAWELLKAGWITMTIAPFKSNHLAECMLRQLHYNSHCRGDAILSKRIAIFWANKGKCLRYHGYLWQGTSALERCGCSKKACVQKKCDVGLSLFLVKLEPPFSWQAVLHCQSLRATGCILRYARIGRGALEWRLHDFCCHAGSPWSQKSPVCVCVCVCVFTILHRKGCAMHWEDVSCDLGFLLSWQGQYLVILAPHFSWQGQHIWWHWTGLWLSRFRHRGLLMKPGTQKETKQSSLLWFLYLRSL